LAIEFDLKVLVDVIGIVISLILGFFCYSSLEMIKRLKLQASMFTPVLMAGIIFVFGSVMSIFHSLLMLGEIFELLHHVFWAVGLAILTYGAYSYGKMLKRM